MVILKPQGPEVSIGSANNVANSTLVRVINTGSAAVLHFASNTGTEYANLTVSNVQYVVVQKSATDTLTGSNMLATPIAWKY